MADTHNKAFRAILWYVTQFCTTTVWEGSRNMPSTHGFIPTGFSKREAQVGDLCILTSAPISEWYLSWLVEIKKGTYDNEYCVQSIETGKLCNWSNVGISFLERTLVEDHPEWRWTDRQHAFNERWRRVCFKHGAYMTLPMQVVFGDGWSVTLGTRERWGDSNSYHPTKNYPDWRKITMNIMGEFYRYCSAEKKAA